MITIKLNGRVGNHLWMYAVCRTVAEHNGYQYHIPRVFLGTGIFNADLGVEQCFVSNVYNEKNSTQQLYEPQIWNIKDGTILLGWFQNEKYIINNKKNIQEWFSIKNPNTNLINQLHIDDNTCVINFRGEDYKNMPDVYLKVQFYYDSIKHMKLLNPNMKFVVITNDVAESNILFPEYPAYHFGPKDDFYIVSQASYLIIANSTFSWWAAWLNNNSKFTIAPKYWFRHNVNQGYWCGTDSITHGWYYVDTHGELSTSNQCLREQWSQDPRNYPHELK
jgi:hypothetical protein